MPYVATFLPFSDYMRGSVRLAALSGLPVIYVWTHDSIGVGEDGPTHQSVEHYAALRAIPNLTFVRPAIPTRRRPRWALALEHGSGPTALVFTRQKLPVLPGTAELAAAACAPVRYVLAEAAAADGTVTAPELILLATGSELHLAMAAREALTAEGVPGARRVHAQLGALRGAARAPTATRSCRRRSRARVSIESGVSLGWDRWVNRRDGAIIAIDRYGMSGASPQIFEQFGFTVRAPDGGRAWRPRG